MTMPITLDGFANIIAALGGADPKSSANRYYAYSNPHEIIQAYRASGWFSKIVNIPADDSVRQWREWKASKQQIETLEAEEKRLSLRVKLHEALILARRDGGSAIIVGGLPGSSETPLNFDRIGRNSIKFLTVLPKAEITGAEVVRDPMSPYYGKWGKYRIIGDMTMREFHASRVILIQGHAPDMNNPWGDSEWIRMADAITHSDAAAAIVMAMMNEAKIDVMRMPDLMQNLANPEFEALLMRRMQLANSLKSVNNALILDKDDEWNQKQISFDTLPDVVKTFLHIMSGIADIPVTRLIGTASSGLNATGENDIRQYYDMIKSRQELVLTPMISQLDEMFIRSALGSRPADVWYEWRSLWQMSEKEESENNKRDAETAQIYANAALVPDDALSTAVQNKLIEKGVYPGLEDALAASKMEAGILEPDLEPGSEDDPSAIQAQPTDKGVPRRGRFADLLPRTLYVRRDVVNRAEIEAWARAQGFTDIVPDMHVTIIYSTSYVDWAKAGDDWNGEKNGGIVVQPGGPRMVEEFKNGAKVLEFTSSVLAWRHESIKRRTGVETDFPDYRPHITISKGAMPATVEPYRGKIVLGPEIFEEVKRDG